MPCPFAKDTSKLASEISTLDPFNAEQQAREAVNLVYLYYLLWTIV